MRSHRSVRFLAASCLVLAVVLAGRPSDVRAAYRGTNGKIAFVRLTQGVGYGIWVINPDGTGETRLTVGNALETMPSFSPSGRQIAFTRYANLQTQFMVMDADGANARTVTTSPGRDEYPITWSPDGSKIATMLDQTGPSGAFTAVRVFRVSDGQVLDTFLPPSGFSYSWLAWRPTATPGETDIAVLQNEIANGSRGDVVRLTSSGAVNLTNTPADFVEGGPLQWTPDGQSVVTRHNGNNDVVAYNVVGGSYVVHAVGDSVISNGQDVSPDGGVLLYLDSTATPKGLYRVPIPPGTPTFLTTGSMPCWGVEPVVGFDVELEAFDPSGARVEGKLLLEHDFTVTLRIVNGTNSTLDTFSFAGGAPLVIDGRSTGGLAILDAPQVPPDLSLDPGESAEFTFRVTTTKEGVVAAHTKVTARDEHGDDVEEFHSLRFDIANAQEVTKDLSRYFLLKAMDQYLLAQFRNFQAEMQKRGDRLAQALTRRLDAQERLEWFGSANEVPVTNMDVAIGLLRGLPPEVIAASRPKAGFKGYTSEELDAAYDETFKAEAGKGLAKYAGHYKKLASDAKALAEDGWAAAVMNVGWLNSTATAEERAQVEAFWLTLVDGSKADAKSLANEWRKSAVDWQDTGKFMWQALEEADREYTPQGLERQPIIGHAIGVKKGYDFWSKVVKKETKLRASILKLADDHPYEFQQEWARQDARIWNAGIPVLLDTLLGGAVAKTLSVGGQVLKVKPKGGVALLEGAKEAGYIDDAGREVAANSKILRSGLDDPAGLSLQSGAEMTKAEEFLANTKGATLVQSSDVGNVYSMPNLGGVPETTLAAKAGILRKLEDAYLKARGKSIQLVEVLKTSSPLRKPGGVAKLELTAAKTGKPSMIDAGMPPDALGEAVYWHSPTHPTQRPGFRNLPKARQEAAIDEWTKAQERWNAYHAPAPNSKEAHLRDLIGKRGRVPLDDTPNSAGIQRFVNGEFEEVVVQKDGATAKLIRVKHYEIEVVEHLKDAFGNPLLDVNGVPQTRVLNRKTVIDNLATAAPQTADADAVAVGKLKGYDADGAPIVEPLSREEREFVMGRYTDENVKARRAGLIPDNAEHGVTLVMEDASALAAGFLLPRYGAPFMPETVGRAYLERIAKFVKPKDSPLSDAQMLEEMLEAVRKEGGFGQHAVVVTSDSRYLGAVPFASW